MSGRKKRTDATSRAQLVEGADDAPELTGEELDNPSGVWRIGSTVVPRDAGIRAMKHALVGKTRTNIHLDNDVLAYFRALAGERGYQTLINAALRDVMTGATDKQHLADVVRLVVREELANRSEVAAQGIVATTNTVTESEAVGKWRM